MNSNIQADASPEKRLFISLLTRDIPLVAAFLDLIDNSINAAIETVSDKLVTAEGYLALFQDSSVTPSVKILLSVNSDEVEISDNASGISAFTAKTHVFKFGSAGSESHSSDRLSVYGIGLKRAIFKLGNKISISSDHIDGGFDLMLDVAEWEKDATQPWHFELTPRPPATDGKTGTKILVSELYNDSKRRLSDGIFLGQLRDAIARTHAFYLSKFVDVYVNAEKVEGVNIEIGSNHASHAFTAGSVSCAITAGISIAQGAGGTFKERASGWFVFCNGRTVISADKNQLTGWGGAGLLPVFQPKHRPFLGTVFFVSTDPEQLPWTTTKAGINEDSAIWQEAKRHMSTVGRIVVSFLDSRYSDEGTEVAISDLREAAGESMSVMSAAVSPNRTFTLPQKPLPENMKIQYSVKATDVKQITEYLGRPGMSGADVGRHTFNYFLRNEVEEK